MSENNMSKIKLKVGSVEVEFEGSEDYIKDELPNLVELLCNNSPDENGEEEQNTEDVLPPSGDKSKQKIEMTTNAIAAKVNADSGADLVIAACAHLYLVKGHETFTRKNILAEMQTASNYYTKSRGKNLSKSLKLLQKDEKLIERSTDTYALSAGEKKRVESMLGV